MSYSHHPDLVPNHPPYPERKTLSALSNHSPRSLPQLLLSLSVDSPVLGVSYLRDQWAGLRVWLMSLSMMSSRFICAVARIIMSFPLPFLVSARTAQHVGS